ncbi:TPA_asm: hypothetical protein PROPHIMCPROF_22 [Mycobacterium phage McProf]|uniref:hypothetical protein n=1 Tax=Mycobacteroides chelonae TaxID=1774 RepID=UPI0006189C28|nr:hypothetical protein [Mycobacteroides chelonae]VEG15695.1 Uncharacterised protein [Mycolicibacterium phlei]DAZ90010.1 TPA_asm: hypothetical protein PROPHIMCPROF_22 [Mycobacterium phage McProf]AKC38419.1 hypothetical protein GR01_07290 [Mycobacteroides chelonae]ANB00837.1 hypothetical protein BB28_07755 [Mycobacteroides chelonae CCUG 47445]OLT75231.1 hypothetical protein BKG56_15840 [Mycobacteroides chelonae]
MSAKTIRAREIANEVRNDAATDVKNFDGRELTGRLVGEINGNTNGLIVGLANCIETLATEIERLENRMPPQQGWW